MSDNGTSVAGSVDPAAIQNGVSAAVNNGSGTSAPSMEHLEDLPQKWQKEIRDLRQECGDKRTRNSALEAEIAQVRNESATREAGFTQSLANKDLDIARYRAAVTSGVPASMVDDFASRLRGSTPDELAADAANLAQLFQTNTAHSDPSQGQRGVDPSQGRGNGDQAPLTPAAQFGAQIADLMAR